nr:MAG TPA: hypothetical protein [Caudoviricetes sp.]
MKNTLMVEKIKESVLKDITEKQKKRKIYLRNIRRK